MENKAKRPISVWIAQIVVAIFVLVLLFALLLSLTLLVQPGTPFISILILVILYLFIILLFVVAFWGMTKRKSYGRWLSVGLLSFMLILSIISQFLTPSGPIQRYEYSNSTQRIAGLMTQIFMYGLLLTLISHIAFAKKVTAFFAKTVDSGIVDQLPPPPSFDA